MQSYTRVPLLPLSDDNSLSKLEDDEDLHEKDGRRGVWQTYRPEGVPKRFLRWVAIGGTILVGLLLVVTIAYEKCLGDHTELPLPIEELDSPHHELTNSTETVSKPLSALEHDIATAIKSLELPPDTPSPSDYSKPHSLFREITLDSLKPPTIKRFPPSHYNDLYDIPTKEAVDEYRPEGPDPVPENAWIKQWKSPDWFDPARKDGDSQKRIQTTFQAGWETKEQKKERLERKEAVKRGFIHTWQAYKDHAWGEFAVAITSNNAKQSIRHRTR